MRGWGPYKRPGTLRPTVRAPAAQCGGVCVTRTFSTPLRSALRPPRSASMPRAVLPCNAFYLIEARSRVPYVGGVLQRLLALFGESELAGRNPITSWLG